MLLSLHLTYIISQLKGCLQVTTLRSPGPSCNIAAVSLDFPSVFINIHALLITRVCSFFLNLFHVWMPGM